METNISNLQQINQANAIEAANRKSTSNSELDIDDFFKLLTVQLTSQDPLKPMDDTEFISQMTGFSTLSEMENMAADMKALREVQSTYNAQNLLGKEVTATTNTGGEITGEITRIKREGDEMVPYIGDQAISMVSIKSISN